MVDNEEGRRSVGEGFYSRATTRALTHVAGFSDLLVECRVLDGVLVLLVWLAEEDGTHVFMDLWFLEERRTLHGSYISTI